MSDQPGKAIPFYTVYTGAASSMYSGHAQTAAAAKSVLMVPTTTLDALVAQQGWAPDWIKVDVEGAEAKLLKGAVEIVRIYQPWVMVEMHRPRELPMVENARSVLDWCRQVGYQAWYMKEAVQMEDPLQLASRGRCHLLLLPLEVEYPHGLRRIRQGVPYSDIAQ